MEQLNKKKNFDKHPGWLAYLIFIGKAPRNCTLLEFEE
jgi:hypothetical protein